MKILSFLRASSKTLISLPSSLFVISAFFTCCRICYRLLTTSSIACFNWLSLRAKFPSSLKISVIFFLRIPKVPNGFAVPLKRSDVRRDDFNFRRVHFGALTHAWYPTMISTPKTLPKHVSILFLTSFLWNFSLFGGPKRPDYLRSTSAVAPFIPLRHLLSALCHTTAFPM